MTFSCHFHGKFWPKFSLKSVTQPKVVLWALDSDKTTSGCIKQWLKAFNGQNCHFSVILAPISCIIKICLEKGFLVTIDVQTNILCEKKALKPFWKTEGGSKANVTNPLHSGCYWCNYLIDLYLVGLFFNRPFF